MCQLSLTFIFFLLKKKRKEKIRHYFQLCPTFTFHTPARFGAAQAKKSWKRLFNEEGRFPPKSFPLLKKILKEFCSNFKKQNNPFDLRWSSGLILAKSFHHSNSKTNVSLACISASNPDCHADLAATGFWTNATADFVPSCPKAHSNDTFLPLPSIEVNFSATTITSWIFIQRLRSLFLIYTTSLFLFLCLL